MKQSLVSLLMIFCVMFISGHAQEFVSGTEVLLTDLNSAKIVGYGKVEASTLNLSLLDETGGFFLYLIFPDGQVATHHGEVTAELVGVFTDSGELLDFSKVLEARGGIRLNIIRTDKLSPEQPSDDERLSQPSS